jgi:hypothetical protein
MTDTSGGVQYSDDGHYYWDGSAWQPVDAEHPGPGAGAGTGSSSGSATGSGSGAGQEQYSEDGKYKWDGTQWQPTDGQQGQDGHQDTVDWSKFPLIEGLTKVDDVDGWFRHIGLEPEDLNAQ